jgi:hypothetical protein
MALINCHSNPPQEGGDCAKVFILFLCFCWGKGEEASSLGVSVDSENTSSGNNHIVPLGLVGQKAGQGCWRWWGSGPVCKFWSSYEKENLCTECLEDWLHTPEEILSGDGWIHALAGPCPLGCCQWPRGQSFWPGRSNVRLRSHESA